MEALFTFFGVFTLVGVLLIYNSFSWGFVSFTFYYWFVLPNIPDLPHFTITQFIGFSLFVNTIIRHGSSHLKDEYKDQTKEWTGILLSPWLTILFGWFIKLFL